METETQDPARVIFNADNVGATREITEAAIQAVKYGLLTSLSVQINNVPDADIKRLVELHDQASIGLHIQLKAGLQKLTDGIIWKELNRQINEFERRFGFLPDHFSGEKDVYSIAQIQKGVQGFATSLEKPLRGIDAQLNLEFLKASSSQKRNLDHVLIQILNNLEARVHELVLIPSTHQRGNYLQHIREWEVLISPAVIDAITVMQARGRIKLIDWRDVKT